MFAYILCLRQRTRSLNSLMGVLINHLIVQSNSVRQSPFRQLLVKGRNRAYSVNDPSINLTTEKHN